MAVILCVTKHSMELTENVLFCGKVGDCGSPSDKSRSCIVAETGERLSLAPKATDLSLQQDV